jgi:hypothetical protein
MKSVIEIDSGHVVYVGKNPRYQDDHIVCGNTWFYNGGQNLYAIRDIPDGTRITPGLYAYDEDAQEYYAIEQPETRLLREQLETTQAELADVYIALAELLAEEGGENGDNGQGEGNGKGLLNSLRSLGRKS